MDRQSYMAAVFIGDCEVSGSFASGDFRSSLNFARRELRGYLRLAESIYRHEVVFKSRRGRDLVGSPALEFGILTETKDFESGTVESDFTVSATYTGEDFASDTRSAFLDFATEDFGSEVAAEVARDIDGQLAQAPWYTRFEIWDGLASYDICGVTEPSHLLDGVEELIAELADGRAVGGDGENPVFHAFQLAEGHTGGEGLSTPTERNRPQSLERNRK